MFRHPLALLLLLPLAALPAGGCRSRQAPSLEVPAAPTPLSVEQWRQLPPAEKYDEATFQRLQLHDPQLQDERAWSRFMAETVIPERRRELPDDFRGLTP